jgi:uncharacterized protein (TIGR03905 family)
MRHEYRTKNTCSTNISFDLCGNIVHDITFSGGCSGNLKAISILVEGMTVEEIVFKLSGNKCGSKNTSCADQLARAVKKAYEDENR